MSLKDVKHYRFSYKINAQLFSLRLNTHGLSKKSSHRRCLETEGRGFDSHSRFFFRICRVPQLFDLLPAVVGLDEGLQLLVALQPEMSRVFLKQKNVFEQLLKEIAFCPAPGTALLRPGKLWSLTVMSKIQ